MKQGGLIARKTPLKNTGTLKRGGELPRTGKLKCGEAMKRAAPAKRAAPIKRTAPAARKPARDTGISDAVRKVVKTRAGCRCERCGVDAARRGGQVHHRRPRGKGGSRRPETNQPGNLVLLCSDCHADVESHRVESRRLGWLVPQVGDPMATPVPLFDGRLVLLHPTEARYLREHGECVLPRSA